MAKVEIKGSPVWECCNERSIHLKNEYNKLKEEVKRLVEEKAKRAQSESKLNDDYDCLTKAIEILQQKQEEIDKENSINWRRKGEIEFRIKEINEEYKMLRLHEAKNVLYYVRTYSDKLPQRDIDNYLCHCQNMIYGHIDGTFLTFEDPTKDNKNEN